MFGLYIHIPFCRKRCPYCDFTTYAGMEAMMPAYVAALVEEMAWVARQASQPPAVDTVYFGGGTPSLLPPNLWERLFEGLHRHFRVQPEAEITVEANPESLDEERLRAWRDLGVNRLSLGLQAVHPQDLRLLGRGHDFLDVLRAVTLARRQGFQNINLDLIFGLPGQPLNRWKETLQWALRLEPAHLSCYALTVEHGTPLQAWLARGLLPPIDEDTVADMYLWTMEALDAAGYRMYEISNWARPGFACRHNLKYWRFAPYLGLGVGAHGFAENVRTANTRSIPAYIQRMQEVRRPARPFPWTPATVVYHRLTPQERAEEFMLMGLRLVEEGVPLGRFRQVVGRAFDDLYQDVARTLQAQGLLERTAARVRLTPRGRMLANQVFQAFLLSA